MTTVLSILSWFRARLLRAPSPEIDEARRRAIRATTLEQLGVSHWSSHTHL